MRRALAVAACATLAGCSGGDPSSGSATAPAATSGAPTGGPAGLEPLLLQDAPTGFTRAGDAVGRTGATDLAEAAADTGDPGAADALAAAGFVQGWQRLWLSAEEELFLLVYEFADAKGAEAFFHRTAGEPAADGDAGVFEVPSLPGAVGVTATSEGSAVTAVVTATGPYLVQVIGNGPEPGPSRGTVVAITAAQVQRLS